MRQSRIGAYRVGVGVALLLSGLLVATGAHPARGEVSAVAGSAYGYFAEVTLGGQQAPRVEPTPVVTLPPGGSATPVTNTAPSGEVRVGPALLLQSGTLTVSTQGAIGPNGSVTSSAGVQNVGPGPFTAGAVSSTCTAGESEITGSSTITQGVLEGTPQGTVTLPTNPAPNTEYTGTVANVDDNFRIVLNEQTRTGDSITVNAVHMYLLGPIAKGDLIIGQSVCQVTAASGSTTTTAAPGPTTTAAPGPTTTAAPVPTTTAAPTATLSAAQELSAAQTPTAAAQAPTPAAAAQTPTPAAQTPTTAAASPAALSGGAYGYFASVSLFNAPAATRGPEPSVTLPEAGASPPLTATAPSARVAFGPAELLTSGRLDVSTEGTAGPPASVKSSASVANVGPGPFTASSVGSTCSASGAGATGSATVTGGRLVTSEGGNLDSDADDTVVPLPENPAPNTSFEGKIETVGDSFRVILNEQRTSSGSITVNAVRLELLGPTAKGELIIGQSRCSTTGGGAGGGAGGGSGGGSGGGAGGGSGGGGGGGSGSGGLPGTGSEAARVVAIALVLLMGGWTATYWADGVRWRRRNASPVSPFERTLLH